MDCAKRNPTTFDFPSKVRLPRFVTGAYIGNAEIKPVQANNPEALVRQIRWASTVVVKAAASPAAQPADAAGVVAPPIPTMADTPTDAGGDASADVW